VLDDAADVLKAYGKSMMTPEAVLLALIRSKGTAAANVLQYFAERRGADLDRLERQVKLAVQSRRDMDGDLKYIASGKQGVDLSRSMVIALDEALSVAQALNQSEIDTDHLLGVMTEREVGTAGILTQFGITKSAIREQLTSAGTSANVTSRATSEISEDMVAAAQQDRCKRSISVKTC